jgi:hypothetical protein
MRDQPSFERALAAARRGDYVAVLGPKASGKSSLIYDVVNTVARLEPVPVLCSIDFRNGVTPTEDGCYRKVALSLSDATDRHRGRRDAKAVITAEMVASPYELAYVIDRLLHRTRRVLLVLDHVECLPTQATRRLLSCLKSFYDQKAGNERYRGLNVLMGGSMSLFRMALERSSPFSKATVVRVQDMSRRDSLRLTRQAFNLSGADYARQVPDVIADVSDGDRYMVRKLCSDAAGAAFHSDHGRVTCDTVLDVLRKLTRSPERDPCLATSFRRIQTSDRIQDDVFEIVSNGARKLPELRLDIGDCELTGAVKVADNAYRPRNEIYRDAVNTVLRPFCETLQQAEKYLERSATTFRDIQLRQINMAQVVGVLENAIKRYRNNKYLTYGLVLLSDSIHYTKSESMTPRQIEAMARIVKSRLRLDMTRDEVRQCLFELEARRMRVAPTVFRISRLYSASVPQSRGPSRAGRDRQTESRRRRTSPTGRPTRTARAGHARPN